MTAGWRSPILAFVAGYVDTAVFVHMGGLFVAHVTGNFVLLGAALAGQSHATPSLTALQLIAFPLFVVAAAIGAVIADRVAAAAGAGLPLLAVAAAMMILAAAVSLAGALSDGPVAMAYVAAMALLNAAQRLDPGLGPPFTVMTGNVTGVAVAIAQRLGGSRRAEPPAPPGRTAAMLLLIGGFALGSAAGAAAQTRLALGAVLVPAVLLAATLAVDRFTRK